MVVSVVCKDATDLHMFLCPRLSPGSNLSLFLCLRILGSYLPHHSFIADIKDGTLK